MKSQWKLAARFFPFAQPYLPQLLTVVLLGAVQLGVTLIVPWVTKNIIDHILIHKGSGTWSLGTAIFVLGGSFLIGIVVQFFRSLLVVQISSELVADLRGKLYRHMQSLSQRYFDTNQSGSLGSRVIQDVEGAQYLIGGGVLNLIIDLLLVVVAGLMILVLQWKLALLCLILLPVYYIIFKKFNSQVRRAWKDVHLQTEIMTGDLVERIAGMKIIQSFQREQHELGRFNRQSERNKEKIKFAYLLSNIMGRINQAISDSGKLMIWFAGALLVLGGDLTIGGLIAFQTYLAIAYGPVYRFMNMNVIIQNSLAHIERIFEVLDTKPDISSKNITVPLLSCKGEIRFENINFSYPSDSLGSEYALKSVSFHANPGELIALVGPSGAGKSTLIQLIPRFYDPEAGKVNIDGVDIREYDLHDLRGQIALVLQDNILFSGTIFENISYGNLNASREEVIRAAKLANVHNFVMDWDQQYDTVVGERGMRLSGGQKQRIAIARALLKNPRILILDEATSALDAESEASVTEALNKLMQGRTTIIIAHRLATVVRADQILVMNRGEIVERGRHHELLAKHGLYRDLYEKQLKAMKPEDWNANEGTNASIGITRGTA